MPEAPPSVGSTIMAQSVGRLLKDSHQLKYSVIATLNHLYPSIVGFGSIFFSQSLVRIRKFLHFGHVWTHLDTLCRAYRPNLQQSDTARRVRRQPWRPVKALSWYFDFIIEFYFILTERVETIHQYFVNLKALILGWGIQRTKQRHNTQPLYYVLCVTRSGWKGDKIWRGKLAKLGTWMDEWENSAELSYALRPFCHAFAYFLPAYLVPWCPISSSFFLGTQHLPECVHQHQHQQLSPLD